MTREHLIEDLENVIELCRTRATEEDAHRLRLAFAGLSRHVEAEGDAPERVRSCLAESLRVLDRAGSTIDEDTWDYARVCLEAGLEFARGGAIGN
ncbi:MAG TPA: hypothetical protein VF167_05645 [Longimicrobiaceae bacterium]